MLPSWIVKLVFALALAVLPLQGIAGTLQILVCQPHDATALPTAGSDERHAEAGAHSHDAGTAHAPDQSSGEHDSHFCCDTAAAALPVVACIFAVPDFPAVAPAAEVLHDSACLKRLQRPPLA